MTFNEPVGPNFFKALPPRRDLKWLGVDLDGTLAEGIWTPDNPTSDIGLPIWENVAKLRRAVDAGYKAVIHTARPWTDYETIEAWHLFFNLPISAIQCGKPLFKAYVDDRAINADEEEWF